MEFFAFIGFVILTIYSLGAIIVKNPLWVKVFASLYLAAPALIAFTFFTGINLIGETPFAILCYVMLVLYTWTPIVFALHALTRRLPVRS